MQTFVMTFHGVPFSQLRSIAPHLRYNDPFMVALQILCESDPTCEEVLAMDMEDTFKHIPDITDEDKALFGKFIGWLQVQQSELERLGMAFHSGSHGADEPPAFLGFQKSSIGLPNGGCKKIDTGVFTLIVAQEKEVQQLFATMPGELVERFPPFGQAGFWSIECSS